MSAPATAVRTARLTPDLFPEQAARSASRKLVLSALVIFVVFGLGFRAYRLDAEGLSEDELNKVKAVAEYRANGLTPANGEHPFLMKAMLAASIIAAEAWNKSSIVASNANLSISTETAARLPGAVLGALTSCLIFLVAAELFGVGVGLLAAGLWAFDPAAIGFNRIAKEDSFLVFFFLLANVFWLRSQRVAEEGARRPDLFYWATAASFGAMLASKYVPHFLAISTSYYYAFQGVKSTRWRLGKRKWLIFFAVMGAAFIICNPTILLPGTWQEMRIFAGEKRIGHDAYEYLGTLYRNQMTLWLKGSPWHFYYVFIGVKLPPLTVIGLIAGLPLLFFRRLGDGRYFIFFWLFFWFFPFTFMGGKFTRYFTFALPVVLIIAALGLYTLTLYITNLAAQQKLSSFVATCARLSLPVAAVLLSVYAAASAAPHYRLYTNVFGGGAPRAGAYFPHDEFYDGSTPLAALQIAKIASQGVRVANETPELFTYYLRLAGRNDLVSVSLSDPQALSQLQTGDVIVLARGRRYFSNDLVTQLLLNESVPVAQIRQGETLASRIYLLDAATQEKVSALLK